MYLRLAAITVLLTGTNVLMLVALQSLQPWVVAIYMLALNFLVLTILAESNWLPQKTYLPSADTAATTTLQIAHETLPYLRRGLNQATAEKVCEVILKIGDVAAAAITDKETVLAFLGVGCEKHQPGDRILTEATKQVLATGQYKIVRTTTELRCSVKDCDCPLDSGIIVPLYYRDEVVGTLKLYQTKSKQLPPHVVRMALGIGQLLSMQIELAELDRQAQLTTLARLEALRAQINPHFFFNTLNTIIMYSRTNPQRARRLLIRLAEFFRHTLKHHGHFVTLGEELEYVHTYLVLEKARFGKKLKIIQNIDDTLLQYRVPVLSLQPLVENAVKHGLTPKIEPGAVKISGHIEGDDLVLVVADDGVGIPEDKLPHILAPGYGSANGVGLSNVNERLKSLYGEQYALQIDSTVGKGTTVYLRVPLQLKQEEVQGVKP